MLPWCKLGWEKVSGSCYLSVPGEGFQENPWSKHSPFRGCIHSPCPAHGARWALQVPWDVAGAVWPPQAGGNNRNSKEGCTDLPMALQGWKSPWDLAVAVPAMGTGAGPALPALPHTFWT